MISSAFERFRSSFFEDTDSARNGLDVDALGALESEDRVRAEDLLLQYLPDTRGVIGLGVLRSRRAEPVLRDMFDAEEQVAGSAQLLHLATALWKIRPAPRWFDAISGVLAGASDSYMRLDAALALHEFRTPAAVRALTEALDDPDGLVRHHAARGLLKLHGLPANANDAQHMIFRVMSDDAGRRETAKQEVLASIDGRSL